MIQDGIYTLVYSNGDYRTVKINNNRETVGDFKDKIILSRKAGNSFEGIAFLQANTNKVMLWKRFRGSVNEAALQAAVNRIARNPQEAGMAYALKEGRCCRCGRELTVPASIHAGMGPDCAAKYAWEKADQVAVHQYTAATRVPGSTFAAVDSTEQVRTPEEEEQREAIPAVPAGRPMQNYPAAIAKKADAAVANQTKANAQRELIQRMVGFQKVTEPVRFYDPFEIGEKLNEGAAVQFWTRRFESTPLDDDRFWGDEAGRQEIIDEQEAELASLRAEEQMNERRFNAIYGNEPQESF